MLEIRPHHCFQPDITALETVIDTRHGCARPTQLRGLAGRASVMSECVVINDNRVGGSVGYLGRTSDCSNPYLSTMPSARASHGISCWIRWSRKTDREYAYAGGGGDVVIDRDGQTDRHCSRRARELADESLATQPRTGLRA